MIASVIALFGGNTLGSFIAGLAPTAIKAGAIGSLILTITTLQKVAIVLIVITLAYLLINNLSYIEGVNHGLQKSF